MSLGAAGVKVISRGQLGRGRLSKVLKQQEKPLFVHLEDGALDKVSLETVILLLKD